MMLTANKLARNLTVLAIVVGIHLALWFVLARIPYSRPSESDEFHGMWLVIEPRVSERRKSATPSSRQSNAQPEEANAAITVPAQSPATDTDEGQIDWHAEGERAAGAVVGRTVESDPRRSFSNPRTVAQRRISQDSVSPFPAPLHKNGDTQFLGEGEIITWVSDKCYATNRPFAGPQLDENRQNVVCKKDPLKARSDLFDHLKPKYLDALQLGGPDHGVNQAGGAGEGRSKVTTESPDTVTEQNR